MPVGGAQRATVKPDMPVATITEQDFLILQNGSSLLVAEERRNFWWGIFGTATGSVIGIVYSVDVLKVPPDGRVSSALICTFALGAIALAAAFAALLRNRDKNMVEKDEIHRALVGRVRDDFAVSRKEKR